MNAIRSVGHAVGEFVVLVIFTVVAAVLIYWAIECARAIDFLSVLAPEWASWAGANAAEVWGWLSAGASYVWGILFQHWSTLVRQWSETGTLVSQILDAIAMQLATQPASCSECCAQCCAQLCEKPSDWSKILGSFALLGRSLLYSVCLTFYAILSLTFYYIVAWAADRIAPLLVGGLFKATGWIAFLWLMHMIGACVVEPFVPLFNEFGTLVAHAFAGSGGQQRSVQAVLILIAFSFAVTVLFPLMMMMTRIFELLRWLPTVRQRILSLFIDKVHPLFLRQSIGVARASAKARRDAISKFLKDGTLPVLRTEYRMAAGDRRKYREHVVRREEEEEGPAKLVPAFLEFPKPWGKSPMVLEQPCLPEGPEEAVGQFVRLKFESQPETKRSWWLRLWSHERNEEIVVPLLARVVDAAILADRYGDTLRREKDWNAMPFYERIYAEYTPLWFPLNYLLRPIIGPSLPARVVIETRYPEVFLGALFGSVRDRKSSTYGSWFGIGIEIKTPDGPRSNRQAWRGAEQEPLCRRLKSQAASTLSGPIDVSFVNNPPLGQPTQTREDTYYVMPSGPLADGCPSVVRPGEFPVGEPERVHRPLAPRGSVSNAPPAWLFPLHGRLFSDCRGNCLKAQKVKPGQVMEIEQSAPGTISQPSGLIARRFRGPDRRRLYRRVWSGAFFDRELGVANRFPLFGCSYTFREPRMVAGTWSRADLRGGFATTLRIPGAAAAWLRGLGWNGWREWQTFGGVFVSTQGPEHAGNLLMPEPLFYDYLNHLAQRSALIDGMKACKAPAFVPVPHETEAR